MKRSYAIALGLVLTAAVGGAVAIAGSGSHRDPAGSNDSGEPPMFDVEQGSALHTPEAPSNTPAPSVSALTGSATTQAPNLTQSTNSPPRLTDGDARAGDGRDRTVRRRNRNPDPAEPDEPIEPDEPEDPDD